MTIHTLDNFVPTILDVVILTAFKHVYTDKRTCRNRKQLVQTSSLMECVCRGLHAAREGMWTHYSSTVVLLVWFQIQKATCNFLTACLERWCWRNKKQNVCLVKWPILRRVKHFEHHVSSLLEYHPTLQWPWKNIPYQNLRLES